MQTHKMNLPEAEKISLISLPHIEKIPWLKKMSEVADSEHHI